MPATSFDVLLAKYPTEVRALAMRARRLILETLPGAEENPDASAGVIGYGYGPGYKGLVCTLILSKTGVKLGLLGGAELSDPERLLAGTGKLHRYVLLQSTADIRKTGVARLLKAAGAAWQERVGSERARGGQSRVERRGVAPRPRPPRKK